MHNMIIRLQGNCDLLKQAEKGGVIYNTGNVLLRRGHYGGKEEYKKKANGWEILER